LQLFQPNNALRPVVSRQCDFIGTDEKECYNISPIQGRQAANQQSCQEMHDEDVSLAMDSIQNYTNGNGAIGMDNMTRLRIASRIVFPL